MCKEECVTGKAADEVSVAEILRGFVSFLVERRKIVQRYSPGDEHGGGSE